ncbi:hypothetical protein, partial [Roseiconus lacunae]
MIAPDVAVFLSLLLHRIDSRTGPSNGDDTSVACQSLLVSRFDIEIPLDIDAHHHASIATMILARPTFGRRQTQPDEPCDERESRALLFPEFTMFGRDPVITNVRDAI